MRRGFLNKNVRDNKKKEVQKPIVKSPGLDFVQLLPSDLVNLITKHLDLDHLIRFSYVCRSWSAISLLRPMTSPWLIVPFNHSATKMGSTCDATLGFFNLSNGNVYKLETPHLVNRRICGSCLGGWIITVHAMGEIQALHPLSKAVIKLPSIINLPSVIGSMATQKEFKYIILVSDQSWILVPCNLMREIYIYKVIMSSADLTTSVVMCIQGLNCSLAFCRPGKDKEWRLVEGIDNNNFEDITFYRGQFYTVQESGHVYVVEGLDSPSPSLKLIITPHDSPSGGHRYYLVEVSGELLLVMRTRCDDPMNGSEVFKSVPDSSITYKTTSFKVSKLDFYGPRWVEGYDLGKERALFVGFNQSFSLTTTDFSGCKGNSIYFTDDYLEKYRGEPFGGHDIGIFHLTNGTIEKCYPRNAMKIMPPPVWFTTCSH